VPTVTLTLTVTRAPLVRQVFATRGDLIITDGVWHINRFGYTARLLISRKPPPCEDEDDDEDDDGAPVVTDSWFFGMGWTSLSCPGCSCNLGWTFHDTQTGERLYSAREESLQSEWQWKHLAVDFVELLRVIWPHPEDGDLDE